MNRLTCALALLLLGACTEGADNQADNVAVVEASGSAAEGNRSERLEAAEERGARLARQTLARDANATASSDNSIIPPLD